MCSTRIERQMLNILSTKVCIVTCHINFLPSIMILHFRNRGCIGIAIITAIWSCLVPLTTSSLYPFFFLSIQIHVLISSAPCKLSAILTVATWHTVRASAQHTKTAKRGTSASQRRPPTHQHVALRARVVISQMVIA